jgi:DNA modification methylase
MEINKVYNMDCLELLKTIDKNSIDLILIDPPYLISRDSHFTQGAKNDEMKNKYGKHKIDFGDWDKGELNLQNILSESYRILKDNGTLIMFYDFWKMQEVKETAEQIKFKQPRLGIFNKTNPVPVNAKINYLSNAKEFFVTFVKKSKPTFNSYYDNAEYYLSENSEVADTYYFPIVHGKERTKHPTQKPLSLIKDLIKKHSNEDDIVLDFFAGSGTTGVGASELNRNYILCEINKEYCEIIEERLSKEELSKDIN